MLLCASPTHLFTLRPSPPALYSPRERYIDALAELRAAETSYLTLRAAEREEEALTHRLRELQLRRQKDRLLTLGQYLSGDAYQTYGLNNSLAEHQTFKAGHDCCYCDSLASSMYPCMYCPDASSIYLHPIGSSSFNGRSCKVTLSPRLKSWTSLNDVDHFTGVKLPLAESQPCRPTSSFSGYRRGVRSLRRPRPRTLQRPFLMGCYGLRDEERLKNIRYYTPFCQTLSTSKPYPHEIISDDKFLEGFAKLFDAPTTHGHQTNGPVQCTPEIAPSRAKTPYECDILDQIDSANILHAPLSASLGPDTELTPAPEGESKPVTSVPAETATIKGGSDIPLPTASSNPSTADPPAQTTFAEINSSIDKIRTIESTFNALKENFTLPAELDFICSTPSTPSTPSISNSGSETESVSATDHLTYSPLNRPVRSYEQALTVLLEQLDGVESLGDTDVRKSRREVVKRVELALDELERDVDGQWRIRVLEPLVNESKLSSKSESHGAVLGLGLHDWKSETGQEDDTQKKDTSDDCADVISSSLPEVMEQNNPSTANTTVNSPDDLSAQNITTPVHDTNPIQAPLVNQLKFSDAIPVADITPSPAQATDFVPSSVPIASTTKLPGDAEIALSISSASSVLEPTPITPSNAIANANAIIHDQEGSIPVNMPAKFAVEPSTPSSLESSSTMSENSGLTTLQGAEIEPEGFFLALSGADESVSGNPITHDSDEEWLEVDA